MLFTAIIGLAFLSLTVCTQVICARVGNTPADFQRMIGSYLVATASGQGVGSMIVAVIGGDNALPPTQPLFIAIVISSGLTFVATLFLSTRKREERADAAEPHVPMAEIFRIPRFRLLLSISVICVACVDLIVIYLPVYGAERGFTVEFVGILLTIRSLTTLLARIVFSRMGLLFGAQVLTIASAVVSAACCVLFMAQMPAWSLYGLIAVLGFALSVCQTVTMTTFLSLATDNIRGTVTSVRMIGNRVGQFTFPVMASMVATFSGVGMIFGMMGAALVLSAGAAHLKRPREGGM
jgi:cyanate permease